MAKLRPLPQVYLDLFRDMQLLHPIAKDYHIKTMTDEGNRILLRKLHPDLFKEVQAMVTRHNGQVYMGKKLDRMKAAFTQLPKEVPQAKLQPKVIEKMVQPDLFGG